MAQLHYITVTCSSSHDPKFKKLSLSLSLSLSIYIYILHLIYIYIYKEERTENRRCKMQIPTNHAYKVCIILWRSLFNLFILHGWLKLNLCFRYDQRRIIHENMQKRKKKQERRRRRRLDKTQSRKIHWRQSYRRKTKTRRRMDKGSATTWLA